MWFRNSGLLLSVRYGVCPDGISLKDKSIITEEGVGMTDIYRKILIFS